MSLRPEEPGRSGRSRSRNRDASRSRDDVRAPSPMDKDYFRRKDSGRGEDKDERTVKMVAPPGSSLPGAFKDDSGSGDGDEEQPRPRQYQVYEPRAPASNVSSKAPASSVSSRAPPSNSSARMPDLPDRGLMYGNDSDEGSDDEERQRFSRHAGIPGSGNIYAGGSPGQGMPYPQEIKYMPQAPVNHLDGEHPMPYYQASQYSHAAPSAYQYAVPPETVTYSAKEQIPKRENKYQTKRDSPTRSSSHRLSYSYPESSANGKSKGDSSVTEPSGSSRLKQDAAAAMESSGGRQRGDSNAIESSGGRLRGDSSAMEPPSGSSRLKQDAAALESPSSRSRGDSNAIEPSGRRPRGDSNIIQPPGSSGRYADPDEYPNGKPSKSSSKRVSISSPTDEPQYAVRAPPGASLAPDGAGGGGSKRSNRLSVSGNRPDVQGFGGGHLPPPSPLLEAYKGTYQSASPMPSPMMLPADLDDIPALEPLSSEEEESEGRRKSSSGKRRRKKKSVKLYDAEGDAQTLAKALKHRDARTEPLIDILPDLTHDQLLHLRDEYKKMVKVQGRGVNIAKQIKMGTTGNFGKVAYVTALGRWESEAHWANFWYQSRTSSRELLIEALMGRTNAEIREIKSAFRDKRYEDSLSRCMEKELKADKFRMAVLLAIEARRQEETDTMPVEYRNQDVDMLHRAISSREGGESAILQIVVTRSDNHLREVLKTYERLHQANFARQALRKSNNLVGEVIAHILNGVINRVARDCLLLHHAIDDITTHNKAVEFRYELLMSRLIRLHWDKLHLARVKDEYRNKYGVSLEREIKEATKNEFGAFCLKLASG